MSTLDDFTEQTVWTQIADAYEHVIVQTSAYRAFEQDILTQANAALERVRQNAGGRKLRILDLGCGLGNVIAGILEQNPDVEAIGIDSNAHMLKRAPEILGKNKVRAEMIHGDVMEIDYQGEFDVVVSSNVVFNLKDPFKFFDKSWDALVPGGEFVVTSAKPNPDLSSIVKIAKQELTGPDIEHFIGVAESLNKMMLGGKFHTFGLSEVCEILTKFCRFETVTEMQESYNKQNFLVAVRKSPHPLELKFEVARGRNRFNESLRLKYHILVERDHWLEPNEERIFHNRYDPHSLSFQIVDARTRTVYACLGHTLDSHLGFPMEESTDISEYRAMGIPLGNFNTIYTVHTMQGGGLGKYVLTLAQGYLRKKGELAMVLAETNPEIGPLCVQSGAVIFPGATVNHNGLPKIDMYFDLRCEENKRKVNAMIAKYQKRYGGELPLIESNF